MQCIFPAHITESEGVRRVQTVREHSRNTAQYAAEKLKSAGLFNLAYLAGLLHDMGKYTDAFRTYISRAADGETVVRGSVNHTFCGVVYLLAHFHITTASPAALLASELAAFAIGSHHGIFDCVNPEGENGFEYRLQKDKAEIRYDEAVANFLADCADEAEISRLFALASHEAEQLFGRLKSGFGIGKKQISFLMGMAARLLLSALTDADRRDTAEFMEGKIFSYPTANAACWQLHLQQLEQEVAQLDQSTPINRARRYFSDCCGAFGGSHGAGIYRLTLPTGAGKTLSSLRYALAQAERFQKKRIIFVIPLLSILEQNSSVIRRFFHDDSLITEHHSNFVKSFENGEALDRYELLAETWESPVIITTLVQLLNALFSDKMSAVRRMSALCDSVLIIDEIQSLPKKTMAMFNGAMNFLTSCCGATVVLSSATQPCFGAITPPMMLAEPPDIVPFEKERFDVFKRTELIDKTTPYGMTCDELSDFAEACAEEASSLLLICNTKKTAETMFDALKARCSMHRVYHLSTSMCMQHRRDTLAQINRALADKSPMICVATQLVEAGVDFSFAQVIRVTAGADSLAQAAGRCNRNGDYGGIAKVYIVNLQTSEESLRMLPEIAVAQRCTAELLLQFRSNPARLGGDLLSTESITEYYTLLFADPTLAESFEYPVETDDGYTVKLHTLLSDNAPAMQRPASKKVYFYHQAFKTAGSLFTVFDESTSDVIVPYNAEAEEIIAELCGAQVRYDYQRLKTLLDRAKSYTIHIFAYQRQQLAADGMLFSDDKGHFTALNSLCYNAETGLKMNFIL